MALQSTPHQENGGAVAVVKEKVVVAAAVAREAAAREEGATVQGIGTLSVSQRCNYRSKLHTGYNHCDSHQDRSRECIHSLPTDTPRQHRSSCIA
jgi:hypothetical protein